MALTNYSNQMMIIIFVNFYAIFSDRLLVRAQSFCHIVVAVCEHNDISDIFIFFNLHISTNQSFKWHVCYYTCPCVILIYVY